jgi:MSHA biogenesis protein MshJ
MNKQLAHYFTIITHKIDILSNRERFLTLLSVITVLYFTWNNIFYENYLSTDKERADIAKKLENQINLLQGQISNISAVTKSNPIKDLSGKISQITIKNKDLENKIAALTQQLIPPDKMLNLLQDILDKDEHLQIVRIDNLPETQLFVNTEKISTEDKTLNKYQVYRHGLQIELVASYFNAKQFLHRLEQLPWKILWDEMSYEVTDYPNAKVIITIYTLSLNKKWISS